MASVISCHKQNSRLVCEFVEHYIETVGEKVYPIKVSFFEGVLFKMIVLFQVKKIYYWF